MKVKASVSPLRLLKRRQEFLTVENVDALPRGMRGIYVLYKYRPRVRRFDVVYVGMAAEGGIRPRLRSHKAGKKDLWTHCSVFEAWENITPAEIKELEGIFRHIYRRDSRIEVECPTVVRQDEKTASPILPRARGKRLSKSG